MFVYRFLFFFFLFFFDVFVCNIDVIQLCGISEWIWYIIDIDDVVKSSNNKNVINVDVNIINTTTQINIFLPDGHNIFNIKECRISKTAPKSEFFSQQSFCWNLALVQYYTKYIIKINITE